MKRKQIKKKTTNTIFFLLGFFLSFLFIQTAFADDGLLYQSTTTPAEDLVSGLVIYENDSIYPDYWQMPSGVMTTLLSYPAFPLTISSSTPIKLKLYVPNTSTPYDCATESFTPISVDMHNIAMTPKLVTRVFTGTECLLSSTTSYEVKMINATSTAILGANFGAPADSLEAFAIVYAGDAPLLTLRPSQITAQNFPPNGYLLRDDFTITFDFDYFYNPLVDYHDMSLVQYYNLQTGVTHYTTHDFITQTGGNYSYSETVTLAPDTFYRWRALLRDSSSTSTPDIVSPYYTISTYSTSSISFIPTEEPQNEDFTGYTYITASSSPLLYQFCQVFPFSYGCDIYDILRSPISDTSTSTVLVFDISSSTSALSGDSGIPPVTLISKDTLSYFFPESIATPFRFLIEISLYLGFAYMVWNSITGMIKIQT